MQRVSDLSKSAPAYSFAIAVTLSLGATAVVAPSVASGETIGSRVRQSAMLADSAITPHGCLALIKKQRDDAYAAARVSKQKFDYNAMLAAQKKQATACAARLSIAKFNQPLDLEDLGAVYLTAGDAPRARAAFSKAVPLLGPSDSARASGIVRMMNLYGNAAKVDSSHRDVEALVSRLDAIPGVALQKVQAHGSLMGWYHDPRDEPIIDAHLKRVLELAPKLSRAEQAEASGQLMEAYKSVAMRQATALHVDSALATLTTIQSRFPGIPSDRIKMWIEPTIEFYRQVGQPGHPISADYWVNGKAAPITGGVSVISFTANWCAPCKLSYAPMEALLKRLGSRGLHETLAVDLDGSFDGVEMRPEKEVVAQRHYFVDEHGVTFPIALQRNPRLARIYHTQPPADSANSDLYQVAELPTFIVLDRHGIIRGALTDWDVNGRVEHSLTTLVEQLLNEN